ncbi:MAG: hypothetical protein AAF517_01185 [Planctomycetota bacterium]
MFASFSAWRNRCSFIALLGLSLSSLGAQDFVPEKHFPERSLVYASVSDWRDFDLRASKTLLGSIISHPAWLEATQGLWAEIEPEVEELEAVVGENLGVDLPGLVKMFQGGVALSVRNVNPVGVVEFALAVELPEDRAPFEALLKRLEAMYAEMTSQEIIDRKIGELDTRVWPTPIGAVFQTFLGRHALFVSSAEMLQTIQSKYRGDQGTEKSLSESRLFEELSGPLSVPNRQFTLAIDLQAIRGLVLPIIALGGGSTEEVKSIVQMTGLGHLSSAGFALGFEDGELVIAKHLGMKMGARGAFEALQAGMLPLGSPDAAVALMPAATRSVCAMRMAPGRMLRKADQLLRRTIPEAAPEIDGGIAQIEANTGLSVEKEIFGLEDISLYGFSVKPPAGGLLTDDLILVKSAELKPYWSLIEKFAKVFDSKFRQIQLADGRKVQYGHFVGDALAKFEIPSRFAGGWSPSEEEVGLLAVAMLFPYSSIARADLGDGWTLLSSRPQSVVRYLRHYQKGPRLSSDTAFAALVKEKLEGQTLASVGRADRRFLAGYNTVVGVLERYATPLVAFGIDPTLFPTGEEFLSKLGPSYMQFKFGPNGISVRALRFGGGPLTLVAGAAIATGLVAPWFLAFEEF